MTRTVVTGSPNLSPIADFTSSCLELACTFTDGSADPDGSVVSWSWTFGDGATSTARSPSGTYAAAGTYDVILTITDNGGAGQQHTATVTVAAAPPPPPPPPPGISLTASGSQQGPNQVFQLTWAGAVGAKVDVYRNGHRVARTPNDGSHTDVRANVTGRATYRFKVCQSTTTVCSNEAKVVIR